VLSLNPPSPQRAELGGRECCRERRAAARGLRHAGHRLQARRRRVVGEAQVPARPADGPFAPAQLAALPPAQLECSHSCAFRYSL
jgi:hypothetical protein